jgi:hypothetical protein
MTKTEEKKKLEIIFFDLIAIYLSLGLHKGCPRMFFKKVGGFF